MKKLLLISILIGVHIIAIAQPGMGEDPEEGIPINSGILYLLLGGLTYGIVQIRKKISAKR